MTSPIIELLHVPFPPEKKSSFAFFDDFLHVPVVSKPSVYITDPPGQCMHKRKRSVQNKSVYCVECGQEIKADHVPEYGFHQSRAKHQKSITDELKDVGIVGHLAESAHELYMKYSSGKICRGASRRAMLLVGTGDAMILNGTPQPLETRLKIFNVTRKEALRAMKHAAGLRPSQCLQINEPMIIRNILERFDSYSEEYFQILKTYYHQIQDKSSLINRSRPTSVVCGLVYYFIVSTKKPLDLATFSEKTSLSALTITKICKEIDILFSTSYFSANAPKDTVPRAAAL